MYYTDRLYYRETIYKKRNLIITFKILFLGTNVTLEGLSLEMLIPSFDTLGEYFHYQGSLTTPGCSEAVVWTIFEQTIPLSKQQLSAFSHLQFHNQTAMINTYRPVQPRYGREVYHSGSYVFCVSTALLVSPVFSSCDLISESFVLIICVYKHLGGLCIIY